MPKPLIRGLEDLGGKVQTFLKANIPYLAAGEDTVRLVRGQQRAGERLAAARSALADAEAGLEAARRSGDRKAIAEAEKIVEARRRRVDNLDRMANSALYRTASTVGSYIREDPLRAVGLYAGVTVGGRLLSGGTLTTNSRGERDIVGIPFI